MKHNILCNLDLLNCEKELIRLKKISNFHNLFEGRKINKILNKITIFICSASLKVDKDFLNKAPNLKYIFSPSTGIDHIDLKEAKKKKIKIFHIAKERKLINNFTATSELGFGLLISIIRNIIRANSHVKKGIWSREKLKGIQLKNKVIGIIGFGRLGKITYKIAKGFGMRILINDVKKISKSNSYNQVSLNYLLRHSHFVFLHVHLNPQTIKLINQSNIKLMRKDSIIINTSRGKIIDEKALYRSLKNKRIAGAGLDVIDGEWLNKDKLFNHKLVKFSRKNDNLLIVPHIGGSTIESIVGARKFILNKVIKTIKYK